MCMTIIYFTITYRRKFKNIIVDLSSTAVYPHDVYRITRIYFLIYHILPCNKSLSCWLPFGLPGGFHKEVG